MTLTINPSTMDAIFRTLVASKATQQGSALAVPCKPPKEKVTGRGLVSSILSDRAVFCDADLSPSQAL